MKTTAIVCKKCGDTVWSRARHDMRYCTCGKAFIDGGFESYIRRGGDVVLVTIDTHCTKKKAFDDWNRGIDKYGIIKPTDR